MTHILKVLHASLATLAIGAAPSFAATDEDPAKETYLFVQHSDTATMEDGILTLLDADPHMVIFADRPYRAAATVPSADMIKGWGEGHDSFASDPPNAALIGQSDGKPVSVVVELTEPKLIDGNLTFRYTVLEGAETQSLQDSYVVIDSSPSYFFKGWADLGSLVTGNSSSLVPFEQDIGAAPQVKN